MTKPLLMSRYSSHLAESVSTVLSKMPNTIGSMVKVKPWGSPAGSWAMAGRAASSRVPATRAVRASHLPIFLLVLMAFSSCLMGQVRADGWLLPWTAAWQSVQARLNSRLLARDWSARVEPS